MVAGLLGAVGAIGGGIAGAMEQSEAAETNWKINLLNYFQREREREEAMRRADRMEADQKLGSTDSRGNRTRFVPGKGWVQELSNDSQQMQDAQDSEQLAVLHRDLPLQRKQTERNYARQLDEDFIAHALLKEMNRGGESAEDMTARYKTAAISGLNENWDNLENATLNKAIRQGSSNIGNIVKALGKGRMEASDDSMLRATMASEQAHAQQGDKRAQLANLYNVFATRASQRPNVSYQPRNIDGTQNALMQAFAQMSQNGSNAAISAAGKKGGEMDYIEPQYGVANTISGAGQALSAAFRNGAESRRSTDRTDNKWES